MKIGWQAFAIGLVAGAILGFFCGLSKNQEADSSKVSTPPLDSGDKTKSPPAQNPSQAERPGQESPRIPAHQEMPRLSWEAEKDALTKQVQDLQARNDDLLQENNNFRALEIKRTIKQEIWEGLSREIEGEGNPNEKAALLQDLPRLSIFLSMNLGGDIGGMKDWDRDRVKQALRIAREMAKEWERSRGPDGDRDGDPARCSRTISRNHANDFQGLLTSEQFLLWEKRFPPFTKPPYQDFYCGHAHL